MKIKYILSTGGATVALMLGLAAPAAAQVTCTTGNQNGGNDCSQSTNTVTDNTNHSVTLGNCSINGDVEQILRNRANGEAEAGNGDDGGNGGNVLGSGTGGAGGAGGAGGSASQSNSQSGSNSLTLTCTTTNVTNVTQAAAGGSGAAQVAAPAGGVHAGAGGAAKASVQALGLVSSVGTMGLGLVLRKWAL